MTLNPWHAIETGEESPQVVNAIIEIPKGSKTKYELDKKTGFLKMDRVLFSSVHYPANYGFIPQTYCDDKDPLDILVLCSEPIYPFCLVEAKVIGVMHMQDEDEQDDKIIAVAAHDMSVNHVSDLDQLSPHLMLEIKGFFEDYKKLEDKKVVVQEFLNANKAYEVVLESQDLYKTTFNP